MQICGNCQGEAIFWWWGITLRTFALVRILHGHNSEAIGPVMIDWQCGFYFLFRQLAWFCLAMWWFGSHHRICSTSKSELSYCLPKIHWMIYMAILSPKIFETIHKSLFRCRSSDDGLLEPYDYTPYYYFLMVFHLLLHLLLFLISQSELSRLLASWLESASSSSSTQP